MTARERPIVQAMLRIEQQMRQLTSELREARIGAGLSQRQVAGAVGIPRSSVERLELGQPNVSLRTAGLVAAAVGLDLSIRSYPGGPHIRDVGQVRLLLRLTRRLGPEWRWRYEVLLPGDRDQRAWDAVARHERTDLGFVVDAETRVRDAQELLRRVALKRRDGGSPRVVLLVSDTRLNRLRLREAGDVFGSAFPVGTRAALAALTAGRDPGHDTLIII